MEKQDLIHKIEWVNKRCSLKGEPLTQTQIELLMFIFTDTAVNKNYSCVVCNGTGFINSDELHLAGKCGHCS